MPVSSHMSCQLGPLIPTAVEERIASRLLEAAARLALGQRETPQRLRPVAAWAVRETANASALINWLLGSTLSEAEQVPDCSTAALGFIRRLLDAVPAHGPVDLHSARAVHEEVLVVAPLRSRRRSIHCHGEVCADRRLLVVRAATTYLQNRYSADDLWLFAAYAISDYDQDHFEMVGPAVEHRLRDLAKWMWQFVDAGRALELVSDAPDVAAPLPPKPGALSPSPSRRLMQDVTVMREQVCAGGTVQVRGLRPIARWAVRDWRCRARLVRYLVGSARFGSGDEQSTDPGYDLLQPIRLRLGDNGRLKAAMVFESVDALLIYTGQHQGQAPNRLTTFLHALFLEARNWPEQAPDSTNLWLMLAAAMGVYRDGHLVLEGPDTQQRLDWLANWLRAHDTRFYTDSLMGIEGRA